jgi:UDP-glucose 4-epimerase
MNIGIIGIDSYIGEHFSGFMQTKSGYTITIIDSRNGEWQKANFMGFDVLLHAAGLAHVSTNPSMEPVYYEVNRDLPLAVARKAKTEGVRQFIFLSSMIVYGDDLPLGQSVVITQYSNPCPENFYGRSKLEAEIGLLAMQEDSFVVSIIRLPMVYGEGCKGNFPKLVSLIQRLPLFPAINNQRSMIYIGNLCAYFKMVIDTRLAGILFPQNSDYVGTLDIVSETARLTQHRMVFTSIFNPLLMILSKRVGLLRKLFGSKVYDTNLSPDMASYNIYSFEQSMERYFSKVKKDSV